MEEFGAITARLPAGCGLAAALAAGFDGFEVIRAAARGCEDRDRHLFAAFALAAGAAVEGRNVLAAAPSPRQATCSPRSRWRQGRRWKAGTCWPPRHRCPRPPARSVR
jgi:hypothetical protein